MFETAHPAAPAPRLNWLAFTIIFCLLVAFFVIRTLYAAATVPLISDTDDAMRLVVVRDFLNGQNWFDHTQYRLNTPFGAQIHWSRFVDLPIAALMLLVTPIAGGMTQTIVAYVWPAILLVCLLYLTARLVLGLVGPAGLLPAMILPALSPAIMAEFSPGRMDHHSIQIILTVLIIFSTIEALARPRFAILAGIASATAIAIGTECLPIIVAVVLVFGLIHVFHPERNGTVRSFGVSFALAALAHLALAWPPEIWFVPACDAISIVYVLAAVGVGIAFTLLTILPTSARPPLVRLGAAVVLGGLLLAGLIIAFPQCLKGPYAALDPWLVENWLNQITEAAPIWKSFASVPAYVIAVSVAPLVALGVIAFNIWTSRGNRREQWLILGLFLAFALVVMIVQIRGTRIAAIIAIPAGCWLIVAARARYVASGRIRDALGLVASWLAFAGIALLIAINGVLALVPNERTISPEIASTDTDKAACLQPAAFDDLAALPPERIMTPIDLGAHMLLFTPHSVVAAPYHRNQQGVRDAFDFFNLPIEDARHILDERGISLVVTCPAMQEMHGLDIASARSFVKLVGKGELPSWLHDVSLPGTPLKVYAVLPR
jgi:hypothetical protein